LKEEQGLRMDKNGAMTQIFEFKEREINKELHKNTKS
jgi:hypothetical protein